MHIFWIFLLVPVLALTESARVLMVNSCGDLKEVRRLWFSSLAIGSGFIMVWLLLVPLWGRFATFLNPDAQTVSYSVTAMSVLLVPYMLMALNLLTDSIFYGLGRTKCLAYQAIIHQWHGVRCRLRGVRGWYLEPSRLSWSFSAWGFWWTRWLLSISQSGSYGDGNRARRDLPGLGWCVRDHGSVAEVVKLWQDFREASR